MTESNILFKRYSIKGFKCISWYYNILRVSDFTDPLKPRSLAYIIGMGSYYDPDGLTTVSKYRHNTSIPCNPGPLLPFNLTYNSNVFLL